MGRIVFNTFGNLYERLVFIESTNQEGAQEGSQRANKMSPEEFAKFDLRIRKAKHQVFKKYPLFGILLRRLRIVPTYRIPTMAVDPNFNIYINPDFTMNKLDFEETIGVLVHEAFHHINLTFTRTKYRLKDLWNIATDYIMNRDILEMGAKLPSLALLCVKKGDKFIIERLPDMLLNKYYQKTGSLISDIDITDLSAEELYKILLPYYPDSKEGPVGPGRRPGEGPGEGPGGGPGEGPGGGPGGPPLDEHLDYDDPKPEPADLPTDEIVYKPMEKKDQSGKELTPADIENKRRHVVTQIAREIKEHQGGSGNGGITRSLNLSKLLEPKIDWKTLLRQFIGKAGTTEYNWARPNKRALSAGYYAPRLKTVMDSLDIVVAVDTSGSIPHTSIARFLLSIAQINKSFKASIKILFYNDVVTKELIIDYKMDNATLLKTINNAIANLPSGGNTESCIKAYLLKQGIKKLNGFLLFTDGHINENPDFPPAKNYMFFIEKGGSNGIVSKYGPSYQVEIQE